MCSTAVAETEAIVDALVRGRGLAGSIAESETQSVAIRRARTVGAALVESIAYTIAIDKVGQKSFSFVVAEVEALVDNFARTRKVTFTQAEVEALAVQTINPARQIVSTLNESEAIVDAIGRNRGVQGLVSENQSLTVSLGWRSNTHSMAPLAIDRERSPFGDLATDGSWPRRPVRGPRRKQPHNPARIEPPLLHRMTVAGRPQPVARD